MYACVSSSRCAPQCAGKQSGRVLYRTADETGPPHDGGGSTPMLYVGAVQVVNTAMIASSIIRLSRMRANVK